MIVRFCDRCGKEMSRANAFTCKIKKYFLCVGYQWGKEICRDCYMDFLKWYEDKYENKGENEIESKN